MDIWQKHLATEGMQIAPQMILRDVWLPPSTEPGVQAIALLLGGLGYPFGIIWNSNELHDAPGRLGFPWGLLVETTGAMVLEL